MDSVQLPDSLVAVAACCTALTGLVLLFLVAPDEEEQRYVLRGEVIARHGRSATVQANVTVIGRNLTGTIEREVFWDGDEFIAVQAAR